jgi:hypothetical protein
MFVPPPDTPTLPSASCRMHDARTIALPMVCWVWPMHQTMVDGRFLAIISAIFNTVASGTPQTSSTLSGVHLAITSSLTLSMP